MSPFFFRLLAATMWRPSGAKQAPWHLASPQETAQIRISSMHLGGFMDGFHTNPNEIKKYGAELAKLVAALVENCDIVGLTEIHPFWYNWLTVDYGRSFMIRVNSQEQATHM